MTTNVTNTPRNIPCSFEDALGHVAALKNVQRDDQAGMDVYSGLHPQYGNIHIIVPLIGGLSILLLPFALQ